MKKYIVALAIVIVFALAGTAQAVTANGRYYTAYDYNQYLNTQTHSYQSAVAQRADRFGR
jgi:outer membrane lipoprotein SlyB